MPNRLNGVPVLAICLIAAFSVYGKNEKINRDTIAYIDSKPITVQEIEDKQINDLRLQLYNRLMNRLRLKALEELGRKYPEYAKQPDLRSVSEKEIAKFYLENDLSNRGTLDELKPRIKTYLESKIVLNHHISLYDQAVRRGLIVSVIEKPNDFLIRVPVGTAYLRGNKKAKVMVLEFSDYQCPFCSRVQSTINKLRKKYKNQVAFGYRHSPLPFHREADEAAIAAECARDQGKFESIHGILFKNYRNIRIENLESYGKQAGVPDPKTFRDCLSNEKYRGRLENDQKAANEAGIRGTPGFIIGKHDHANRQVIGELISGAQPQSIFEEAIKKYIE